MVIPPSFLPSSSGTMRSFSPATRQHLRDQVSNIPRHIAESMGGEVTVELEYVGEEKRGEEKRRDEERRGETETSREDDEEDRRRRQEKKSS